MGRTEQAVISTLKQIFQNVRIKSASDNERLFL